MRGNMAGFLSALLLSWMVLCSEDNLQSRKNFFRTANPSEVSVQAALTVPGMVFIRNLGPVTNLKEFKGIIPSSALVPGGYGFTQCPSEFYIDVLFYKYLPGGLVDLSIRNEDCSDKCPDHCSVFINYWFDPVIRIIFVIDNLQKNFSIYQNNSTTTAEYLALIMNLAIFYLIQEEMKIHQNDLNKSIDSFFRKLGKYDVSEIDILSVGLDEDLIRIITQVIKPDYSRLKASMEDRKEKANLLNYNLITDWLYTTRFPSIFPFKREVQQEILERSLACLRSLFVQNPNNPKPILDVKSFTILSVSSLYNIIFMLSAVEKASSIVESADFLWEDILLAWHDPDSIRGDPSFFIRYKSETDGIVVQKRIRATENNIQTIRSPVSTKILDEIPEVDSGYSGSINIY